MKRANEWTDPRFKNADFGPGVSPRIKAQQSGFELVIVEVDIKRLEESAQLELNEIWILDSAGEKYKSPVVSQDKLGEQTEETREFVFAVPKKSELKRIELAASTFIELP